MATFSITLTPLSHNLAEKFKWCIDAPLNNSKEEGANIVNEGLLIRGWLLCKEQHSANLVLLDGASVSPLSLNESRPDVVKKLVTQAAGWENNLCCGFRHNIKLNSSTFMIALVHESNLTPLYSGRIDGPFKIIKGRNKWLFLDNDTNNSVEQFTGKIKLSRTVKNNWKQYMISFASFTKQKNLPSVFLIAPSKEMIYEDFYPFKKSKLTPAEQVEVLQPDNFPLLSVQQCFKESPHRTFRVCDTHWSARGAMLASLLMCERLYGKSRDIFEHIFDKDEYVTRKLSGDLGSKVYPPQSHDEDVLTSFNYRKHIIFDNALPNFGRTIIIENGQAEANEVLLIFGSSSAYSMFNYLSRLFNCVVFCHTAGSIDDCLVEQLAPNYLAAQTNARFLVKAPLFGVDLRDIIESKCSKVTHIDNQIDIEARGILAKQTREKLLSYLQL